jgi:hypothetical protein
MEPSRLSSNLRALKSDLDHLICALEEAQRELELRSKVLDAKEIEFENGHWTFKRSFALEEAFQMRGKALQDGENALSTREQELRDRKHHLDDRELAMNDYEMGLGHFERVLFSRAQELEGFAFFPKLPLELQRNIWFHAIANTTYALSRVHSIKALNPTNLRSDAKENSRSIQYLSLVQRTQGTTFGTRAIFLSPHGIDPLLHSCSEARNFVIKNLDLTFAFETWINFTLDTILLDRSSMNSEIGRYSGELASIELLKRPEMSNKIRNLALRVSSSVHGVTAIGERLDGQLQNLEELFFVVDDIRAGFSDHDHVAKQRDVCLASCKDFYDPSDPRHKQSSRKYEEAWVRHTNFKSMPTFKSVVIGERVYFAILAIKHEQRNLDARRRGI